jgi:hypothetical protein
MQITHLTRRFEGNPKGLEGVINVQIHSGEATVIVTYKRFRWIPKWHSPTIKIYWILCTGTVRLSNETWAFTQSWMMVM